MTALRHDRPDASEYAPFYAGYVAAVPGGDLLTLLERQLDETLAAVSGLSESRANVAGAPGK